MSSILCLTTFLLTNFALALPQSNPFPNNTVVPVVEVFHKTEIITEHVTQTDHVTITDAPCRVETALPPAVFTKTITLGIGEALPLQQNQASQNNEQPVTATTVVYAHSAPLATLQPAVHWDHNLEDLNNLNPVDSHQLYFTESGVANPAEEHTFASITTNYTYPAIILEHSSYISAISCEPGGLKITFSSPDAASAAQKSWSAALPFVLATHTSGCGAADSSATHAYFLVSSVSFSGLDASITAVEIALENAMNEVDLVWGHYNAGNSSTGNGLGSSGTLTSPSGNGTSPSGNATSPGSTGAAGNSENNTAATCGQPPASTIDGFPAAPCGEGFDAALDAAIGYVSFDDQSFSSTLANVAPGITDDNVNSYEDDDIADTAENAPMTQRRRSMRLPNKKRWGFSIRSFFQKASNAIVSGVQQATAAVKQTVTAAVDTVKAGVTAVVDAASKLFDPSLDKTFNLNLAPSKLVDSPWGQAFQLFKKEKSNDAGTASGSIALYCVECGVAGKVHVGGQLSFSIIQGGISKGNVGLDGNVEAGLYLGLAAEAQYSQKFKTPITSAGIPGLTIPNIITIGPVLALAAEVDINIGAEGQVLAGAKMSIPNFGASVDLVSGDHKADGFTPMFTPRFEAAGQVKATAGLGVPVTVGVGLDILPLGDKGRKLVSIINKPSIQASATYAYSNTDPGPCNNGIAYSVNFLDDTSYDLFGLKNGDIFNFKSPDLLSNCILLGSTPPNSGTPSSGSSDTGSSNDGSSESNSSGTGSSDSASAGSETSGSGSSDSSPPEIASPDFGAKNVTSTAASSEPVPNKEVRVRQAPSNVVSGVSSDTSADLGTEDGYAGGTQPLDPTDNLSDSEYQSLSALAASDENDSQSKPNSDGSVFVTIHDSLNQYLLSADEDGGFNLQRIDDVDSGTTFLSYNGIVGSDDSERIMHYHPDLMAAFGVSRFRMSTIDSFPKTADIVTLAPLNADDSTATPGVYVAADTQNHIYYPVVCNLQGQSSKIFLAADPVAGLQTLMREDLRYILTGGIVQNCFYLAFVNSGPGL